MELATSYLGLTLRNPLVASPSPLSQTSRRAPPRRRGRRRGGSVLAVRGAGAPRGGARTHGSSTPARRASPRPCLLPGWSRGGAGPRHYLSLLERPRRGRRTGHRQPQRRHPRGLGRLRRARCRRGAAAIELNIYYLPGDPQISGRDVEQRHLDVLSRVKERSPCRWPSSWARTSARSARWRSDSTRPAPTALVLFNRFLQPDIDPETLTVGAGVALFSPAEARLPRTWIALLRGQVRASLAATTGVETVEDVAKYLLAGADVVMTASALLRHGPEHAGVLSTACPAGWLARASPRWTSSVA